MASAAALAHDIFLRTTRRPAYTMNCVLGPRNALASAHSAYSTGFDASVAGGCCARGDGAMPLFFIFLQK